MIHPILFLLCSVVGVLFCFLYAIMHKVKSFTGSWHIHQDTFVKISLPIIIGEFLKLYSILHVSTWPLRVPPDLVVYFTFTNVLGISLHYFFQLDVNLQLSPHKSFNNSTLHCALYIEGNAMCLQDYGALMTIMILIKSWNLYGVRTWQSLYICSL